MIGRPLQPAHLVGVADVLAYRLDGGAMVPLQNVEVPAPRAKGVPVPRQRAHSARVTAKVTRSLLRSCVPDLDETGLGTNGKVLALNEMMNVGGKGLNFQTTSLMLDAFNNVLYHNCIIVL